MKREWELPLCCSKFPACVSILLFFLFSVSISFSALHSCSCLAEKKKKRIQVRLWQDWKKSKTKEKKGAHCLVLCWVDSFSLLPLLFRCFILGVGLCICSGFTDEFWKLFSGVFGLLGFWYFSWASVGFVLYFLGLLQRVSSEYFLVFCGFKGLFFGYLIVGIFW